MGVFEEDATALVGIDALRRPNPSSSTSTTGVGSGNILRRDSCRGKTPSLHRSRLEWDRGIRCRRRDESTEGEDEREWEVEAIECAGDDGRLDTIGE